MRNHVELIGNLGKDPEVKTFQNGGRVVNFTVATSESWKDKQSDERKEKTEWHNVVVKSEGLVSLAEKFLKKGSKVLVVGQLETRNWEKDGVKHYTTEVVLKGYRAELKMLDAKSKEAEAAEAAADEPEAG